MRNALIFLLGAAALGASGCASLEQWASGADLSSIGRGRAYAERECARCHAITGIGESPNPAAPNFGSIRLRYVGPALERELEAIANVGHYAMPPLRTEPADRRDLIAYIEAQVP